MASTHFTTIKRTFHHLSPYARGEIAALYKQGKSLQVIADAVGYHKSTVSRELQRGKVTQMTTRRELFQTYLPDVGQRKYEENRKACGAKFKLADVIEFVHFAENKMLDEEWSPDAVCGHAKLKGLYAGKLVCTKTLYNYIDQGILRVKNIDLPMKLRLNTKKQRVRKNKRILGRSIEERPVVINERQEFGHWEIDTVLGKKSQDNALLTLTERQTREEIIVKIQDKTSEAVSAAIKILREKYGVLFSSIFKTITSDNGSEFADLTIALKEEHTTVYFTHPYTSSERGTNERHNGLIRRFIPKGKAIFSVSDDLIHYVERWCNKLPRKILGYRTPEECFEEALSTLTIAIPTENL